MTTTRPESQYIFKALIAGLGVAGQNLGAKCEAALRAVGGLTVPYLRAAAAEASPRRRNRIELLAATIRECQDNSPNAAHLIKTALLTAAAAHDHQHNPALVSALKLLGPTVVDTLVREAICSRKKPSVCLRILEVIEQLGSPSKVDAQFEVAVLIESKNSAVRELATKLFCQMRPRAVEVAASP